MQVIPVTTEMLDDVARKKADMSKRAEALMFKAKLHVATYHPFYGALISRMKVREDWRHPTMYTDAVVIGYSPIFVLKKPWNDILYIFAHEATHCALGHPFRLPGLRKMYAATLGMKAACKIVGIAADHVVNLILNRDPELRKICPKDGYCDPRFSGMAVQQVAAILYKEELARREALKQCFENVVVTQPQSGAGDNSEESDEMPELGDDSDDDLEDGDEDSDANDQYDKSESDDDSEQDAGDDDFEGDVEDSDGDGEKKGKGKKSDSRKSKPIDGDSATQESGAASGSGQSAGGQSEDGEEEDEMFDEDDGATGDEGDCLDAGASGDMVDEDGEPITDPDEAQLGELQKEWEEALMTAQISAGGDVGADMGRALGQARKVNKTLEEYIDEFLERCAPSEPDWARPARRFQEYLPANARPGMGILVAGIDTSASMDDDDIALEEKVLNEVMETWQPLAIIAIYCDDHVCGIERFERGEYVSLKNARGGGGTRFHPVFRKVLEMEEGGEEIAGVIYASDLDGILSDVEDFQHLKVLWVQTSRYKWAKTEPPEGLGSVCVLGN